MANIFKYTANSECYVITIRRLVRPSSSKFYYVRNIVQGQFVVT